MTTVIAAPTSINAAALTMIEATTAPVPEAKMNGKTGTIAPSAKRKNDVAAATQAEPPSSSGLIPSSSRASVSTAWASSPPTIDFDMSRACSAVRPLAW